MSISHPGSPLYEATNIPGTAHHGFPSESTPCSHKPGLANLSVMCPPCRRAYIDLYTKFPLRAQTLDTHGFLKHKHPIIFSRTFEEEYQVEDVLDLLQLGLKAAFPKTKYIGVESSVIKYSRSLFYGGESEVSLSVVVDFPERVGIDETVLRVLFGVEEARGWEVWELRGVVEGSCEQVLEKGGSCVMMEWVCGLPIS